MSTFRNKIRSGKINRDIAESTFIGFSKVSKIIPLKKLLIIPYTGYTKLFFINFTIGGQSI